ncbi:MAG: response regulator [Bacteroidota bacterium]|nr:response regulator [Bacteroidota bacterium]
MARIVLCVDDDPDDRELIRNAIFKIDPSFTVADATNGKEALQYLARAERTELPCLVIMDINMPVMDGKQTVVEIKKNEKWRQVPIVVFSTSSHPADIYFCEKHGVELVTKPANFKQITHEAERLLQYCTE